MIDRKHPLSVVAQCKLLGLSRARVYRLPTPPSAQKLDLMKRIDKPHMDHPHRGLAASRISLFFAQEQQALFENLKQIAVRFQAKPINHKPTFA
jgi:hypothetical protein